jgi:hypothetical protein
VAVNRPLRCLFRASGTRPTEADHARANRDPESAGLRLHAETVPRLRPWLCAVKQCRSRGHQAQARKPQPQCIRGQQLCIDVGSTASRTLLAHITSPLVMVWLRPAPWPSSGRPRPLSRPAALTASGARGLPPSAAPAVFRLAVRAGSGQAVRRSAVVPVERAVDPEMLGIGYLLPGSPRRASSGEGRSRVPCRERCHRVRFLSDRRTSTLRQTRSARRI